MAGPRGRPRQSPRAARCVGRGDLDDASDARVLQFRLLDAGNKVHVVDTVDDDGEVFAQLVREILIDDAADDRRLTVFERPLLHDYPRIEPTVHLNIAAQWSGGRGVDPLNLHQVLRTARIT